MAASTSVTTCLFRLSRLPEIWRVTIACCGLFFGALTSNATVAAPSAEPQTIPLTRFHYEAFIGGTLAGVVVVDVERDEVGYEVNGTAETIGFWRSIDDWQAEFNAAGRLIDGVAVADRYVLLEKNDRKDQQVVVSDGQLFVTKNGEARTPKDAHPGVDLLTALWVVASCVDAADLHNGRHGYAVARTLQDDGTCRYDVRNDDGDNYSANVRFTDHGGYPVLERMVVNRLVGTRLQLVRSEVLESPSEVSEPSVSDPAAAQLIEVAVSEPGQPAS